MTYTSTLEALVDDSPQPAQPQGARSTYNSTTNTETHDALPFTLGSDTYKSTKKNADGNSIETHTHILPKVEFRLRMTASTSSTQSWRSMTRQL